MPAPRYIGYKMPLPPGTRFGPYEIVAPLGAGGMGEVYRAFDSRLNREVALKVLSRHRGDSRRLTQEARAVAALNHPNIIAIYDVGEDYIVTELVEGHSLRGAAFPLRKTIDIAVQIADGLAAAHTAGFAHRDLKPENIMLGRDGRPKILDFGLARPTDPAQSGDVTRTLEGIVVGTAAYMSPEQVRGLGADHRSDIFSFGLILYELLSGSRAYSKETAAEVMTAILNIDPPELPPSVPAGIRDVVRHCLEKDPLHRFQSAYDLAFALRSLSGASMTAPAITGIAGRKRRRYWVPALIAAALVTGAALTAILTPGDAVSLDHTKYTPIAVDPDTEYLPAFSPDGKSVAYVKGVMGLYQIYVRALDSPVATQVTRTVEGVANTVPFWSPDGARVFYGAAGNLWSVSAAGGTPQRVMGGVGASAALSPDGKTVVFARPSKEGGFELATSSPPGAEPQTMPGTAAFPDKTSLEVAPFSADGSRFVVIANSKEAWVVPFPGGKPRLLPLEDVYHASWYPDGRHLVACLGSPWRVVLADADSRAIRTLVRGPEVHLSASVSPDGKRIIYSTGLADFDLIEYTTGGQLLRPLVTTSLFEARPQYSPAGDQIAYVTIDSGGNVEDSLWTRNADGSRPTLLVSGIGIKGESTPVRYSPDGQRIAYSAKSAIWTVPAAGGHPALIANLPVATAVTGLTWSPDGNWIGVAGTSGSRTILVKLNSAGGEKPVGIREFASSTRNPRISWSPDGLWLVYLGPNAIHRMAPDGTEDQVLTGDAAISGDFAPGSANVYYYIRLDAGRRWRLISMEVPSGRVLKTVDLQLDLAHFFFDLAIHPDGQRMILNVGIRTYDLWMMEGFPTPATGIARLWRHWADGQ